MRVERPLDRRLALAAAVASTTLGTAAGALVAQWPGAASGLALGGALGLASWRAFLRRTRRRRALLAKPFPARWRSFLLQSYDHYERLDAGWRSRFESDLRLFLVEKRITGVDVKLTDELRLLVAASAVTLSVGWPDYEWDQLTEVLLYPGDFDRDYKFGESDLAGQAHPEGTVILSVPSLEKSFEYPDDAYHVGLHEFTHVLDLEHARFDGIPDGLVGPSAREWARVAEREMERLRKEGSRRTRKRKRQSDGLSAFDPYCVEPPRTVQPFRNDQDDPVEFLAVAVEAFFEIPQRVRRDHADVYRLLSQYFGQDPAAWDDARGLQE